MQNIDEYIASFPENIQAIVGGKEYSLDNAVLKIWPESEEKITILPYKIQKAKADITGTPDPEKADRTPDRGAEGLCPQPVRQ